MPICIIYYIYKYYIFNINLNKFIYILQIIITYNIYFINAFTRYKFKAKLCNEVPAKIQNKINKL